MCNFLKLKKDVLYLCCHCHDESTSLKILYNLSYYEVVFSRTNVLYVCNTRKMIVFGKFIFFT